MNKLKLLPVFVVLLLSVFSSIKAYAQSIEVPDQLTPWVDWVLHDEKQIGCPYRYNNQGRNCAWPSRLQLDLNAKGGRFTQQWHLYSEGLIQLPGEADHWPLNVTNNGNELLVQSKNNTPYVRLPKGKHTISGQFKWSKLPKSLFITPGSGLVDLSVNNSSVARPVFNAQGQLWLLQSDNEKVSEDNIDMQVFRRVADGHPVQVETLIKLRVSGKQRNTDLGSVLLDDFIATRISSDLPARLEGENQLKVQLRPGEWSIRVIGRAPSDIQQFTMPELSEPWPPQEVWVFVSDNNMRQVQVSGVTSIDPNQTRLPNEWKGLPAYLLTAKQSLKLNVKERGITNLARNDLNLKREMWLDFDGLGYSIKDQLNGVIQQSRINVLSNIELGRVSINEQPQFITRETGKEAAGVEIRQKTLNLGAESRYVGAHSTLPANGWSLDLQKVEANLHLPPGWRVLAVTGTDNLPNTWVEKWSLLDLFLVIIIIMSVRHFFGWRWAGVALGALVLTWQENGAPNLIWLNLLAVTALLSVLRQHKVAHWLEKYRLATLAVLAVILLGYMINTIRISIYPQLDRGYTQQWRSAKQLEMDLREAKQRRDQYEADSLDTRSAGAIEEIVVTSSKVAAPRRRAPSSISSSKVNLQQIDPNSMIQSGPGLPSWSGYRNIRMSWAGPVKADQTSRLILVGPKTNFVIQLLGIALLLAFAVCFVQGRLSSDDDSGDGGSSSAFSLSMILKRLRPGTAALALCFMLPMMVPESAQAQAFPDQQMLDTLKQRLLKAPDCLTEVGSCAQIQQMSVSASADTLQLRLRVHALTDTSIPLPANQDTWLPKQVLLNGNPAAALGRDANQVVWLSITRGHHDLALSGPMSQRISFPLALPLVPKYSSWSSEDNSWTVEGIDEDGVANAQLQFTRVVNKDNQETFQSDHSSLPTFVKVERRLSLGLDWYVQTTVSRVSPQGVPLNINVPLLANEQLLDAQLKVENGQVALSFAANQYQLSWSSKLTANNNIVLTAANSRDYLEVWNIDASPVWRVQAKGLPVNRFSSSQANGQQRVIPVWQPWPGEVLTLDIDRPAGVAGQTVTIQSSKVSVTAGKRANDVTLNLSVRSSRGIQHQIRLPDNAEVQELEIDEVKQRVQVDNNMLSLLLKPGKQDISIKWREPNPQAMTYAFPAIDLQLPSVNAHASVRFPRDRWVLWANGPVLGPAVLFWSVLSALLVLSIALGLSKQTPLNIWQWFLLAIGLSQTSPSLIVVVVACLISLSIREKLNKPLTRFQFNFMQVGLILLIVASLSIMVGAVANGLLGSPDMQIAGNGSNSYALKWYQDRATAVLPQPEIISVPIWVYRVLMLAWAMWLAMSLLKWIKWGWQALSAGEFWRKKSPATPVTPQPSDVSEKNE